jgi:hydroxyacylglutathione hydrolase
MTTELFSSDRINNYTYRIKGLGGELCYLVEGQERALLIDSLCGVGSLKEYVEGLTKLPVTVVLSHAHGDHCGGAWEYEECYLHPDDLPLFYSEKHTSAENRFAFVSQSEPVRMGMVTCGDVVQARPIRAYPVYEGDIFDLGNVQIEVISVPGHSYGSVVFLDRAARLLYSGDACNIRTIIGHYGAASVEEYRESLLHLKKYQEKFDFCYGGHGFYPVRNTVIEDALVLCEKILSGTDDKIPVSTPHVKNAWLAARPGPDHRTACGGEANILYMEEPVRKRTSLNNIKG